MIKYIFLILLIFTGCSSEINELPIVEDTESIVDKTIKVEENMSNILEEEIVEKLELTPSQIRNELIKNISIQIYKILNYDNGSFSYNFLFGCYSIKSLEEFYGDISDETKKEYDKCVELKDKLDNLYEQKQIIETNTKNIIEYSSNEVEELPFNINLLNINPSMIRFELDEKQSFSLFVHTLDYECLFMNGTFKSGENIILNENNCFINTSSNVDLIFDFNNQNKKKSITSDSLDIEFQKASSILRASHPILYGSNVTWELQTILLNPSKNKYKIVGLKSWVSKRDINGSFTDSDVIDKDTISGKSLIKKYDNIILNKNDKFINGWEYNYSDLPAPIIWIDFDYYYEMK
jgi:uncharacterized protein YcfL